MEGPVTFVVDALWLVPGAAPGLVRRTAYGNQTKCAAPAPLEPFCVCANSPAARAVPP